jgi:hypothetical protein
MILVRSATRRSTWRPSVLTASAKEHGIAIHHRTQIAMVRAHAIERTAINTQKSQKKLQGYILQKKQLLAKGKKWSE